MKGRNWLVAAVVLAASLFPLGLQASADCGPGYLVTMKSKGIVQQVLAFSTNGTFFPTWAVGVTSGTSACSNSGVVGTEAAVRFVAWNEDKVQRDFARGEGEYLTSVAYLLGCPAEARADFARFAQAHLAVHGAEPAAPAAWVAQVRAAMAADPVLSRDCAVGS